MVHSWPKHIFLVKIYVTFEPLDTFSIFKKQNDLRFHQISIKINSWRIKPDWLKRGHQPQSETSKSSSTPVRALDMSSIFEGVLYAFNQIFNIAPSGHLQTIHNIIKDTSPSQEHKNHHQLQQKFAIVIYLWGASWCLQTHQNSSSA